MRDGDDITRAIEAHANTVLRVCSLFFGTRTEREDAFQDTFLKYAQSVKEFTSEEHRKAWLINVAANVCRDALKQAEMRTELIDNIDENTQVNLQVADASDSSDRFSVLNEALQKLDDKYRVPLYLKYYECYSASEISEIMHIPENTVYTNLSRGREKLKEVLTHGR